MSEREITPNQVVAYNLRRARDLRGWKQEEAATHLQPFLQGPKWSKAVWSAAERSYDGERVRQFDADEIVAFARAFDLPVYWFFLPPCDDGTFSEVNVEGAKAAPLGPGELLELLFSKGQQEEVFQAIAALLDALPKKQQTAGLREASQHANYLRNTLIDVRHADLRAWAKNLGEIKDYLEEATRRAAATPEEARAALEQQQRRSRTGQRKGGRTGRRT